MIRKPTAEEIRILYDLRPLPVEGGLFRRMYQSQDQILYETKGQNGASHKRYLGTAIVYLLTPEPDSFSALHRLPVDEVYHFYLGDPVQMLLLYPDSTSQTVILGPDILDGQHVQFVVPAGVWQGSFLKPGGQDGYAFIGTTMAPGFHDSDYQGGDRNLLAEKYPPQSSLIKRLTRLGEPLSRPNAGKSNAAR